MDYRPLGSAGTRVATLCLGTMTFGKETAEAEAFTVLDSYVAAGGNFLDTADVYQQGVAEEFIGRWLKQRGGRDDLVIASKVRFPMPSGGPDDRNRMGLSRRWIVRAIEDSLTRLGTDFVDLYQAHCWDPLTPLEESLSAFDDLVTAGKVRYLGVSNFTGWQLQRAALLTQINSWAPVVTLQPQYNMLAREIEWELTDLCVREGIGILPWSPLAGGWLSGKYRSDEAPTGATRLGEEPGRGVEAYDKRNNDRTWAVLAAMEKIMTNRGGVTLSQIAINWVTARPGVTSTILGARTNEQLQDNLASAEWRLDEGETALLDDVSSPPTPDYPYGFIQENDDIRRK
jgi:aryl-alcohol dehydrogenase-like predicted oxidoreductase